MELGMCGPWHRDGLGAALFLPLSQLSFARQAKVSFRWGGYAVVGLPVSQKGTNGSRYAG